MNPVGWFEIPVNDMDRAQKFYEAVFGYPLDRNKVQETEMAWFPMGDEGYGSSGSLVKADVYTPSHEGTLIYFSVGDFPKTLDSVEQNGGKILMPETSIGEHGFVAHIEDTEGNRIAIHRRK